MLCGDRKVDTVGGGEDLVAGGLCGPRVDTVGERGVEERSRLRVNVKRARTPRSRPPARQPLHPGEA